MRLVDELLAREAATGERFVLWEGRVEEMTGGTASHDRLSIQLIHLLMGAISDQLEVFTGNMRLAVPSVSGLVYPDVAVARDATFIRPADTLTNPIVICEVLSKSTEAFDRGDKFRAYRAIRTVKHYVLVSQNEPSVEVFTRAANGRWPVKRYTLGERALLPAIDVELDVTALYKRIRGRLDPGRAAGQPAKRDA